MLLVTTIIGVLTAALGVCAAVMPGRMLSLADWKYKRVAYVAAAIRAAFGVVFILAAPGARFPTVFYGLGALALVAAGVIVALPASRWRAFVEWWLRRPRGVYRAAGLGAVALGAFIVYASCV